jgi:dipeptidyl aminopeptidase/acylaminoacyl peptidase
VSAAGENRSPLTADQIVSHKRPSNPQISPDGSKVLFTVRQISKPDEHVRSAIWLVDGGNDPAQFSSGLSNDDEPRWSPDGLRIAFLSDRAERGKSTVYVMPATGGEATRVFEHEGEMESLKWTPDGSSLSVLFTEPETPEDKKRSEDRDDATVWDADYKYQRLWVIDPDSERGRCVSPPERQVLDYAWSPDSEQIAIATTPTPRIDDIFKTTDLSIINRSGGEPRSIHAPCGVAQSLVWSHDAQKIAWIGPHARVVNGDYVYCLAVDGGEPLCLTSAYGGTVESIAAIGAGEHLLMQGAEGMNNVLYRLGWSGNIEPLTERDSSGAMPMPATISNDGNTAVAIWECGSSAPDVWLYDLKESASAKRLTHFNEDLELAAIGTSVCVSWPNGEGDEIEGMLFKPPGFVEGTACPLVVQVHGGPTSRWTDEFTATWHDWAHTLAGRGIAVLLPNPRGSTGRGPDFTNAIFQDVAGGEYRDMMTGVDAMIERGIADPDRLGIGGWSWGGFMAAWTITQTDRFKAAIVGAGLPNMVSDNGIGDIPNANLSYFEKSPYEDPEAFWERSAIRYLSNAKTPTLILHGEDDHRVNMTQGLELYTGLKSLGVETTFVTYPREGHGIMETNHQRDLVERVVDWFTRYLVS